ncbi:MAG: general secretion pathway protein GspK [Robiginitomaculum sp.]|nr:general secretion pathway protein GspK [Robiginitomaculum sp.]
MKVKTYFKANSKSGYILLAVISILIVTSMLATIAVLNARMEAKIARTDLDNSKMRAGINTAIARSIFLLGEENGTIADGRALNFDLEDMSYKVRLVDDRGLVGLNTANRELLEKIIKQFAPFDTDTKSLADAILDWRDADSDPRHFGAEARSYANQNLPPPANRPFVHIAELGRVSGINRQIFAAISPLFSISTKLASPDPQFTPLAILEVLDLAPSELSQIMNNRENGQTLAPKADNNLASKPKTNNSGQQADVIIYHAFVEVSTNTGTHRAERLQVRLNPTTGHYDLYGRQVINYGSSEYLFDENIEP